MSCVDSEHVWAVRFSAIVYRTPLLAMALAEEHGLRKPRWIERNNAQAMVGCDDGGTVWVVARGTDEWRDWLDDLRVASRPVRCDGLGWAHSGMADYARNLWQQVRWVIDPTAPVIFTGHSLGGAAAVLLALWARADGQQVREVITFGAPRCLRGVCPDALPPVIRYERCADLVPRVLWWRYRHVGQRCYIDRHGAIHARPVAWPVRVIDRLIRRWSDPMAWFRDHRIVSYRAVLEAAHRQSESSDVTEAAA